MVPARVQRRRGLAVRVRHRGLWRRSPRVVTLESMAITQHRSRLGWVVAAGIGVCVAGCSASPEQMSPGEPTEQPEQRPGDDPQSSAEPPCTGTLPPGPYTLHASLLSRSPTPNCTAKEDAAVSVLPTGHVRFNDPVPEQYDTCDIESAVDGCARTVSMLCVAVLFGEVWYEQRLDYEIDAKDWTGTLDRVVTDPTDERVLSDCDFDIWLTPGG